jgi:DNA-binding protein YbaB
MEHDEQRYAELSNSAASALQAYEQTARALAASPVDERSPDGSVWVRVTSAGAVVAVRLRPSALRRYGHVALGDVVTRTLRAGQQRAREQYAEKLAHALPPDAAAALAEADRLVRDARGDVR